jgi:hypothetical protein
MHRWISRARATLSFWAPFARLAYWRPFRRLQKRAENPTSAPALDDYVRRVYGNLDPAAGPMLGKAARSQGPGEGAGFYGPVRAKLADWDRDAKA